ncbi:Efflux pump, RND family, outer membrane lipoprotein [Syntrophobacter sp. SbD1]|nr:Efflux pump, RND family, outer membrane lipoprotein [Syntrophobacter sp. SbD1]
MKSKRPIIFLPFVLAAILSLVGGCLKVGPDFTKSQAPVSPKWLETRDERVKDGPANYCAWWETFNDPVLNSIIDRAYHENLSLQIAAVKVLEARAQLGIAVGNIYPQTQNLNGSQTFNRFSTFSNLGAATAVGAPGVSSLPNSYWQDQVGLNVAWELDFWGKFRRAVESADATLRGSVADYDSALVTLTADAANSYIQIRILEKRIEIAKENLKSQRESLKIAEDRFHGGVTSERDVEQARTILFNTEAAVPVLEAQIKQNKDALSVLIGIPPNELSDILGSQSAIPVPPPAIAAGIPADLLRRRPDVRSAELLAAAQSAKIGVAKADLFPAFSLTGSFGLLSTDLGAAKLSDIFRANAATVTAGPSVQWNILNYGQITNNVRLQDARFQELLLSYQNTVLKAQQEVEDFLAGFLRYQENAQSLALSASAAKHSLQLAFIQYSHGSTDFTTVLSAQQSLLLAQDSLATSIGNIALNLVGVYRALGGGWEIRKGEDILPPQIKEIMARRTNWGDLLSPAVYMPAPGCPSDIRSPDW